MKACHSFREQAILLRCWLLLKLLSTGLSASMISGVNFFCLGFTNSVLRWRFLGDLRFGWFSDDLFLMKMKINTDGTTFGFNVFMWPPALSFVSVILKWNSHTYVWFITLNESFPPALRNVLILLDHNQSSGFASLSSGNLNKRIFAFSQSLSYCAFLHTGMQQYFPFLPILSCFGSSSTVFS